MTGIDGSHTHAVGQRTGFAETAAIQSHEAGAKSPRPRPLASVTLTHHGHVMASIIIRPAAMAAIITSGMDFWTNSERTQFFNASSHHERSSRLLRYG